MLTDAPRRLFALVDCSNFCTSCERIFRPDLARVPIAVLSDNDGCIVARSEEVKALGVSMGAPFFEVREKLEANGVVVFSSNYELYADLSRRVMATLATFSPDVEAYSIDEAFLSLSTQAPKHREHARLTALAREIRAQVMRWTGIPVRVSIAETKTLAKIGSEYAKALRRRGHEPCVSLYGMSDAERDLVFRTTPAQEVWGVGRACEKLRAEGLAARAVQVFFNTGHRESKGPHRSAALAADLPRATNITLEVLRLTSKLVEAIWQDGSGHQPYRYKKAGVMMLDLTKADRAQGHIFLPERPELGELMGVINQIKNWLGKRTVVHGAEGTRRSHDTETGQDWAMRREWKSPAYTTRWEGVVTVRA